MFDFLSHPVYGDLTRAGLILVASLVVALVAYRVVRGVILGMVRRTKTDLDDLLLKAGERPFYAMIILGGLYLAVLQIDAISSFVTIIRHAVFMVFIGIVTMMVAGLADTFYKWYAREVVAKTETTLDDKILPLARRVTTIVIIVMGTLVILEELGISITPMITGLGIGGIAIALAVKDTLSNFMSATQLLTDGYVKIGDYIEMDSEHRGVVQDVSMRTTKILLPSNSTMVIPNSKLTDSFVINRNLPDGRFTVWIPCGVSYSSDLEKVERVTLEVARQVVQDIPGAVKDFEPLVRFNKFGDSNIEFNVICQVEFKDRGLLSHTLIKALKNRYDQEGIEISVPARKLFMANGLEPGSAIAGLPSVLQGKAGLPSVLQAKSREQ